MPFIANARDQLWIIHGEGWSLPVVVQWFGEMGRARVPDIPLTKPMLNALHEQIAKNAIYNGEDWYFIRQKLEVIGDLLPADAEIEEQVHWTRQIGRRVVVEQPPGMEGFFEGIASSGYDKIKTAGEAQLLWGLLIRHMLDWLVNKKQPLNLGFAILQPLPYRPNWFSILMRRYLSSFYNYEGGKKFGPGGRERTGVGLDWREAGRKAKEKILESMTDERLFFFSRKKQRAYWTLHVKHLSDWWKTTIRLEDDRKQRRPGLAYVLDIQQEMKDRAKAAHEIFTDQASQARKPYPRIPKGARYYSERESQKYTPLKLKSIGIDNAVAVVFDERTGKVVHPSPQTAKGLRTVSFMGTFRKNMRKRRTNVEQSRKRKD